MEAEVGKGANVRQISVKDYWKSQQAKKMREEIKECRECYWNNQAEINLLLHGSPKAMETVKESVEIPT